MSKLFVRCGGCTAPVDAKLEDIDIFNFKDAVGITSTFNGQIAIPIEQVCEICGAIHDGNGDWTNPDNDLVREELSRQNDKLGGSSL